MERKVSELIDCACSSRDIAIAYCYCLLLSLTWMMINQADYEILSLEPKTLAAPTTVVDLAPSPDTLPHSSRRFVPYAIETRRRIEKATDGVVRNSNHGVENLIVELQDGIRLHATEHVRFVLHFDPVAGQVLLNFQEKHIVDVPSCVGSVKLARPLRIQQLSQGTSHIMTVLIAITIQRI